MKRFGQLWCAVVMAALSWIATDGGTAVAQQATLEHGSPVSLGALLAHAEEHAPFVSIARSRLALGEAEIEAASPLLIDNLQLEVSAGPRTADGSGVEVDFGVGLSQRLEIGGERGLRLEAADRSRDVRLQELTVAEWQVHQAIHATFHSALVARQLADLATRIVEFQEGLLRVTEQRVAAGDVSPLNVRLAEAEVGQARQEQIARAQDYRSLCLRLAELSGWAPDPLPEPEGTMDAPRAPPSLNRLLALAREHHPVLGMRRAAIAEARARVRLEAREGWPEPSFGVSFARETQLGGQAAQWLTLGTLTLPLPLWRRNQGDRARAHAAAEIADAELDALRRTLTARLSRLATEVAAAAERVRGYGDDILPRFDENLTLLSRAFELGEIDLLQLSVARERFMRIQLSALAAHQEYFNAVAALEAEIGVDPWPDAHHGDHGHEGTDR